MSNETKNIVGPRLRFPECRNTTAWSYKNGNELFDPISDKNHNSDLPILAITQEHGAIPRNQIDYNVTVTDKSIESYKVVELGDFIISLRSFQGGIEYSNYKGICSPAYIILRKKNDIVDNFFKYYFKTRIFIHDLNKNIEGIRDGKMVSYKQFSDLLLPFPPLEEQQKIADCLSSLDALITAQSQKLQALKAHKTGLMQQLFPAEGEKLPKVRFPQFRDKGEWQIHIIGDFIESYKGGAPLTPSDFVQYSNYQVIPKKAIHEGVWLNLDGENPTYCSELFYKRNLQSVVDSTYLITTLRDLVPSGPSIGYIVKYVGLKKYILAQGVYGLKPKTNIVPEFLIHFSNTLQYRKLMNAIMVGSTQVHIRNGDFLKLPIKVPLLEEQQKIADCFSSLDEQISAQIEKIEVLKAHKNGLMQQLFPAV